MRFEHFSKQEISVALETSPTGRKWLLGAENADAVFAGYWTRTRRDDIETQVWRWHDEDEVELIVQGQLQVQLADDRGNLVKDIVVAEGDILYIGKGVRHRADSIGDGKCIGLLFCPKAYSIVEGQPSWSDEELIE